VARGNLLADERGARIQRRIVLRSGRDVRESITRFAPAT
jgi:hypothetical protein